MEKYMDLNLSARERAKDLLSKMDTEEKLRQLGCTMIIPGIPLERQDLNRGIGVSIVMTGEEPEKHIKKAQEYIMEQSPHHIPALFHGEALVGPVSVFGGIVYPISIGLGATFEPEILQEMSDGTRKQMLAIGVRHGLSPVADLGRDLRWGRLNETYGTDPVLSAQMTVSFVRGLQGENLCDGVAATGKHFIGYSQTEGGLNCHKTMVSRRELREQFAKPFEAAIREAGLKSVMNSYSAIDGQPVCANKEILTDLLRDDLGFDGPVISDYGSIGQLIDLYKITSDPIEAGICCMEAGLDIECPSRVGYGDGILTALEDGRLSMDTLDQAVLRVLTLKFELGLFENPFPRENMLPEALDNTYYNEKSLEAARKSITMVKNEGLLPITDSKKKILVIGPAGNCMRMLFSHYTAISSLEMMLSFSQEGDTQQGYNIGELLQQEEDSDAMAGLTNFVTCDETVGDKHMVDEMIKNFYPTCKTTYEAIQSIYENADFVEGCDYKGNDGSHIQEAVEAAKNADIVIAAVGGKNGLGLTSTSGEGVDTATLKLPGLQEKLLKEVFDVNQNMVIVHTDAAPLVSEWAYENVPAILEAWLPNAFGGIAIADVISGKYNPAGRTPVDVPRGVGHLPMYHCQANGSSSTKNRNVIPTGYIDSEASALAPFGFGLSYTSFEYSDAALDMDADGNVKIKVKIKNVGTLDGDEVVQLYGSDLYASMIRPIHELIGFKRVHLKAGESTQICFAFHIDFFSFLDRSEEWLLEAGDFRFVLGGHSDDERCVLTCKWPKTMKVDYTKRCLYAAAREI